MRRAWKLTGIWIVLSCAIATESAMAQCNEVMGARLTVSCTGPVTTGYEPAPSTDDVDVTVSGLLDESTSGSQAILLNDDSTIVNMGTIEGTFSANDAIKIGNNAGITNAGTITGGSDAAAAAIRFTGTDVGAINTLENRSTGVIGTAAGTAIVGSVGKEQLDLRAGSIVNGDIDLAGGDDTITVEAGATISGNFDLGNGGDTVTIESGATIGGDFDLGNGADRLTIADGATYSFNVVAGAGADTITLEGSDGGGSTLSGNIDLGDAGGGGTNVLVLEQGSILDGTVPGVAVTGGAEDDSVTVGLDAEIRDDIVLGDGANLLDVLDGGSVTGDVTGGSGVDSILLRDGSSVTGNVDLFGGADLVDIQANATLTGTLNLGDGAGATFIRGAVTAANPADHAISIGEGMTLTNTGTITGGGADVGASAIVFTGVSSSATHTLTNGSGGIIQTTMGPAIVGSAGIDTLILEAGSTVTGEVVLMGGADELFIGDDAILNGDVDLGDGADSFILLDLAEYTGALDAGDGNDIVVLQGSDGGGSTFTGDIDLGNSDTPMDDADTNILRLQDGSLLDGDVTGGMNRDVLELLSGSTLMGDANLAGGGDTLDYESDVLVTGTITLGDGDDTVILRPGAVFPPPGVLVVKGLTDPVNETDTLRLGFDKTNALDTGSVDLFLMVALEFDALEIDSVPDPMSSDDIVEWTVSTSSSTTLDAVNLKTGTLVFGGTVNLTAPMFTQLDDTLMVFNIGQEIDNSFLNLNGALTLDPRADSAVRVVGSITAGDYTLISASGGITGTFDDEDLPTVPFFDLALSFPMGTNIYQLTVTQTSSYGDFAVSQNQTRIATYLEVSRGSAGMTTFNSVLGTLDALIATPVQLATALSQLDATSYDAHTSNILSWGRVQQRELQQRSMRCERFQYTPLPGTVTDSPCGSRSVIPWTKVLGSSGQNNPSGNTGYDSLTGGLLAGIDYRWSEQLWLSASMGYGTVEIDHDIGGDSDFKSIDVGVAAGTVRGPLTVRGSFSYSHGFHDITRDIDFLGTRFEGQFDSDRTSVALGAGYRVKLGPLVIEPNAMLDFSHVEEGRVKEKGGSDGSLDVRSRTTDLFSATAGLQLSTHILKNRYSGELLEWADGLWVPTIRTQWRQAVGSDDRSRVASLQGASAAAGSFKSKASDSASGFEVAAHLSFQPMESGNAIEIGYDGFFADDVTNHAANVTLRIPF